MSLVCRVMQHFQRVLHKVIFSVKALLKGHSPDKTRQRQGSPERKGVLHFAVISESHPVTGDSDLPNRVLQQPRTKPSKTCALSQILLSVGCGGGEDTVCSPSPQAVFERKKSSSKGPGFWSLAN